MVTFIMKIVLNYYIHIIYYNYSNKLLIRFEIFFVCHVFLPHLWSPRVSCYLASIVMQYVWKALCKYKEHWRRNITKNVTNFNQSENFFYYITIVIIIFIRKIKYSFAAMKSKDFMSLYC